MKYSKMVLITFVLIVLVVFAFDYTNIFDVFTAYYNMINWEFRTSRFANKFRS